MIIIVLMDPDSLLILSAPFPFLTKEPAPFGEVGIHNWMYGEDKVLVLVIQEVTKVFLNFVLQNQGGGDFACSVTGRADFLGIDGNLRLHSLPGDLHEPKF